MALHTVGRNYFSYVEKSLIERDTNLMEMALIEAILILFRLSGSSTTRDLPRCAGQHTGSQG